jgi:hypothetical protein
VFFVIRGEISFISVVREVRGKFLWAAGSNEQWGVEDEVL